VQPRWKYIQSAITQQLLPMFVKGRPKQYKVEFDLREIGALAEDRADQWKRVAEAAKTGIVDRNEARGELGYDPIDLDASEEPVSVWLNVTVRENAALTAPQLAQAEDAGARAGEAGDVENADQEAGDKLDAAQAAAAGAEEKDFRRFARKRQKEGKLDVIKDWEFKFVKAERQAELLAEFGIADAQADDSGLFALAASINKLAEVA
jgi:hypothetical protein